MPATIQFTKSKPAKTSCIIVPMVGGKLPKSKGDIASAALKYMKSALDEQFDGKNGSCHSFSIEEKGAIIWYVMAGIDKTATSLDLEKVGGKLYDALKALKIKTAFCVDAFTVGDAAALANGAYLKSYDFTEYKTKDKPKKALTLKIGTAYKANADKVFSTLKNISDSVFQARDYVTTPPNDLYPSSYAAMIKKFMKGTGVKTTVLDEKKLIKMGAGALMAVGKASVNQPRLVIFEYDGRKKKVKSEKPLALVGKGVTYDTGGYSLKPSKSMETMKMDMGGSAAVVGAIRALAANKAEVYVVGAVALAENMIAGNAYRVDDVLTSLSGQTIEVLNTDAEGRLCLADALTYIQDKFDPRAVVDVATLTGAVMGALGLDIAGVFSNDTKLSKSFVDNGETTGDDFWALPVNDAFSKQLESPIADMRNLGLTPYAGASTAAAFLQNFITNDRAWAHLDIAGTAWRQSASDLCPKGASGFGVRSLYHWAVTY